MAKKSKLSKVKEAQNPFEGKNGIPKPGKEKEFFECARKKYLEYYNTLSEEEKVRADKAEKALMNRMNS